MLLRSVRRLIQAPTPHSAVLCSAVLDAQLSRLPPPQTVREKNSFALLRVASRSPLTRDSTRLNSTLCSTQLARILIRVALALVHVHCLLYCIARNCSLHFRVLCALNNTSSRQLVTEGAPLSFCPSRFTSISRVILAGQKIPVNQLTP